MTPLMTDELPTDRDWTELERVRNQWSLANFECAIQEWREQHVQPWRYRAHFAGGALLALFGGPLFTGSEQRIVRLTAAALVLVFFGVGAWRRRNCPVTERSANYREPAAEESAR